jgi:hypothetical protein
MIGTARRDPNASIKAGIVMVDAPKPTNRERPGAEAKDEWAPRSWARVAPADDLA